MANCWFYSPVILLSLSIHTMDFNQGQLKAVPTSAGFAGVFMIPENGKYMFNATAASDACLRLGATIATKEQMGAALQRGFQTCKFGWMEGPEAVVPRITQDQNCGKSKLGLVPWKVEPKRHFCAFCFKAEDVHITIAIPGALKPTTTATRRRYAWTTASTQVPRYTSKDPTITKQQRKFSQRVSPHSTAQPLKPTWRPSWYSPSSSSPSSSPSLPLHSTSRAAPRRMTSPNSTRKSKSTPATPVRASSLSSFPLHPSSSSATTTTCTTITAASSMSTTTKSPTENMLLQSSKASLGALQVALIVVGLIVLVVSLAAASWYYKLPRCLFPPPWAHPKQPRDMLETEMRKHTDSDTHLQTQLSEEDKTDGKNATEATLCISQSDTNTIAAV